MKHCYRGVSGALLASLALHKVAEQPSAVFWFNSHGKSLPFFFLSSSLDADSQHNIVQDMGKGKGGQGKLRRNRTEDVPTKVTRMQL